MGFFDKLNKKELDKEIFDTEVKIKQSKFKINELEQTIKILQRDIINLSMDYEMMRLLKIKVDNPHLGNEYLEPSDIQTLLHTILKTNDSYEKINNLTNKKPKKWENL